MVVRSCRASQRRWRRGIAALTSAALLLLAAAPLPAQELIVYPGKGQTPEQQEKDKYECYSWAKQQSGFDPMAPPTTATAPPPKEEPKGGVLKGGAVGALTGLAIGAIAGDAGKGAAIGAVGGGVFGGIRRSDQQSEQAQAQKQWEQKEVSRYSQARSTYNRAFSACMQGRGYTVQ
jgi:hypothetical protein